MVDYLWSLAGYAPDLTKVGVLEGILLSMLQFEEEEEYDEWIKGKIGWTLGHPDDQDAVGVCEWTGIKCDQFEEAPTILSIGLPHSNLQGTIPTQLGWLISLTNIDLSMNNLRGTLPTEIVQLPNLITLNLGNNNLDGTLPTIYYTTYYFMGWDTPTFASTNLQYLNLASNRFQGTIHDSLLQQPTATLLWLDLSKNALYGTIPIPFLYSMPNIDYFDVSYNMFEGSVPAQLGDLRELHGLFLDHNEFMGTVPPKLTREHLKIVQFFVQHNFLSGTIPAAIADLRYLRSLFVDGNRFTGTIPEAICKLDLNEEFFETTVTDFDHKVVNIPVNNTGPRNGCTTIACPAATVGKEGLYPCYPCHDRDLNPYIGQNDKCFHLNDGAILEVLYTNTNGPNWKMGSNAGWGITKVHHCNYAGITCNGAGHVVNITLSGINLLGEVPPELGFMQHLEILDLSDNMLTGYLPSDLRFAPLEYLDVSGNAIRGFVPPMLCLTSGINGNGADGTSTCDVIACSEGHWSPIGRATTPEEPVQYECIPCYEGSSPFLGSKTCNDTLYKYMMHQYDIWHELHRVFFGIFFSVFFVCGMPVLYRKYEFVRLVVDQMLCREWFTGKKSKKRLKKPKFLKKRNKSKLDSSGGGEEEEEGEGILEIADDGSHAEEHEEDLEDNPDVGGMSTSSKRTNAKKKDGDWLSEEDPPLYVPEIM
uniref:Leucine-rich repeat-containing N-terminal plant-type domain-containing protein n=3 Tax=Ditylum brightwellii TaxID=49249 RepID=A0A7S4VIX4_9STRA